MDKITFNDLPKAVRELNEKIDKLIALQERPEEKDRFLDIDQLCDYLPERPARATVYGWVARRTVPFYKEGRKLLFRKSEIDTWLENGRSMKKL
jgi:excisionase family DNA binding protein